MAIRQAKIVYVSDRGLEFEVEKMKATHLLNTIRHLNSQIDTLNDIPQCLADHEIKAPSSHLAVRVDSLIASRNVLALELARRNPDKDEEYEDEHCGENYW